MLMRTLVGPSLSPSSVSDTFILRRLSLFRLRLKILSGLLLPLTLHHHHHQKPL